MNMTSEELVNQVRERWSQRGKLTVMFSGGDHTSHVAAPKEREAAAEASADDDPASAEEGSSGAESSGEDSPISAEEAEERARGGAGGVGVLEEKEVEGVAAGEAREERIGAARHLPVGRRRVAATHFVGVPPLRESEESLAKEEGRRQTVEVDEAGVVRARSRRR